MSHKAHYFLFYNSKILALHHIEVKFRKWFYQCFPVMTIVPAVHSKAVYAKKGLPI